MAYSSSENPNIIRRMKGVDFFIFPRLNLLTGVFVLLGELTRNIEKYYLKTTEWTMMRIVLHIPHLLYITINPVMYILVMRDLRNCYAQLFRCERTERNRRKTEHTELNFYDSPVPPDPSVGDPPAASVLTRVTRTTHTDFSTH